MVESTKAPSIQLPVPIPQPESTTRQIPLDHIRSSPYQARQDFDEPGLQRLAKTLKKHGLQQPILVRPIPTPAGQTGDWYELVDGERRCRATRLIGGTTIEAKIQAMDEEEAIRRLCLANAQRKNLNPMEQAGNFNVMSEKFNMTQEAIAEEAGLEDASSVRRYLSLLKLPDEIQKSVHACTVSMRQALEIMKLDDQNAQIELANRCVATGLAGKALENEVKRKQGKASPNSSAQTNRVKSPENGGPDMQFHWKDGLLAFQGCFAPEVEPGERFVLRFKARLDEFMGQAPGMGSEAQPAAPGADGGWVQINNEADAKAFMERHDKLQAQADAINQAQAKAIEKRIEGDNDPDVMAASFAKQMAKHSKGTGS